MTNPSLRQWVVVGENDEEVTKNSILRYTLMIVLFVIVVQPMLNYAALKHGREYLMENVTLYDVGFGQKLVLYWRWKTHRDMMFLCNMTSESLTLGTHSLDLSLNNSFAKDPRMLRCGKEELGQVTRVGWCEPTPYNNSTDPGQAALANTTLGPASTLASDLHRLITVAHPQERPLGLVGSKRDEFVQSSCVLNGEVSKNIGFDQRQEFLFLLNGIPLDITMRRKLPSVLLHIIASSEKPKILFLLRMGIQKLILMKTQKLILKTSRGGSLICNWDHMSLVSIRILRLLLFRTIPFSLWI